MSGHSKWATTKHKKAAIDAKRSSLFSKLSRNITVAAKIGGDPNPDNNATLAAAVQRARMVSMPNAKIKAAIDAAVQDGISSKWGGKKPANLKQPLRDGDAERADEAPEYEGMYFLNCNSTQKPGIVDKELNEILDPDEVYSGCWGRASINFFPFNPNGNKGVGVGLNNIQKLKDDDRLGAARASAESDFGGDDFEDDEDF